jgi:hypothetical protein
VRHLRTGISWADWHTPEGEAWYAWLLPQLSRRLNIVPSALAGADVSALLDDAAAAAPA